jgi:hypothetical protein
MIMQPLRWFASPELRREHKVDHIRKNILANHAEVGYCTNCARVQGGGGCTLVSNNTPCHCCTATASSKASGTKNTHVAGTCADCYTIITQLSSKGQSEAAVREYMKPLLKLFPDNSNVEPSLAKCVIEVHVPGPDGASMKVSTDVDVAMEVQVHFRESAQRPV